LVQPSRATSFSSSQISVGSFSPSPHECATEHAWEAPQAALAALVPLPTEFVASCPPEVATASLALESLLDAYPSPIGALASVDSVERAPLDVAPVETDARPPVIVPVAASKSALAGAVALASERRVPGPGLAAFDAASCRAPPSAPV
jgi:hypothetical protein